MARRKPSAGASNGRSDFTTRGPASRALDLRVVEMDSRWRWWVVSGGGGWGGVGGESRPAGRHGRGGRPAPPAPPPPRCRRDRSLRISPKPWPGVRGSAPAAARAAAGKPPPWERGPRPASPGLHRAPAPTPAHARRPLGDAGLRTPSPLTIVARFGRRLLQAVELGHIHRAGRARHALVQAPGRQAGRLGVRVVVGSRLGRHGGGRGGGGWAATRKGGGWGRVAGWAAAREGGGRSGKGWARPAPPPPLSLRAETARAQS